MAYREFSRGPHTQFMAHFIDTVHFVTGAKYPDRVMAMGGTFRWKDARRTAPDSIEVVLEYKEGFLARYNSSFGTNGNSFLKFLGTRGTIDATKWSNPWLVSAEGAQGTKIPEVASDASYEKLVRLHAVAAAAGGADRDGVWTFGGLHHGRREFRAWAPDGSRSGKAFYS